MERMIFRCVFLFAVLVGIQCEILAGGLSDADENDPGVLDVSKFAVQELDKSRNSIFATKLVRIRNARTQVRMEKFNGKLKIKLKWKMKS